MNTILYIVYQSEITYVGRSLEKLSLLNICQILQDTLRLSTFFLADTTQYTPTNLAN